MIGEDGIYRMDPSGELTRIATRPSDFWGFLPVGDTDRLWLGGDQNVPALLDVSTALWRLPESACDNPGFVSPSPRELFMLDGVPRILGDRADGSGQAVLYTIHLDGVTG